MYYKLVGQDYENIINIEQSILDILSERLDTQQIDPIIKIYLERQAHDVNFREQDFLLDLKGYLKYLELEKKYPFSFKDLLKNGLDPSRQTIINELLQQYGPCQECHLGNGSWKKVYLATDTNEIIRFYYAKPSEFFYNKLFGKSEADISRAINNNLLTVAVRNVPGKPIDIVERVVPLSKVYPLLFKAKQEKLFDEIEAIRDTSPLIAEFIEDINSNSGLAVRLDKQGQKKVYLVGLDLEPRKDKLNFSNEKIRSFMKKQYFELKLKDLGYKKFVTVIPELAELSGQSIK